jgi:hypothetical protein
MINFIKIFFKQLFTTGIFLAFVLALLELISTNNKYVQLYAFAASSFFIINFFQFYIVDKYNKSANLSFLTHSIYGGISWTFYAIVMYLLYINDVPFFKNILYTSLTIISVMVIHFYLVVNNFFGKKNIK